MNKLTLSVKEVSAFLGVSQGTIYSMVRAGEIPYIKIRGRVLFHQKLIEEWVLNNIHRKEGRGNK